MIDAEVTLDVSATCDQCMATVSEMGYPDPWGMNLDNDIEDIFQIFVDRGWEIEGDDALCPACVKAREDGTEPLDPNRNNGGINPRDGVGIPLFDLFAKDES